MEIPIVQKIIGYMLSELKALGVNAEAEITISLGENDKVAAISTKIRLKAEATNN